MKKRLKYFGILILSLTIVFGILVPTKADSGFDASYDSGGGYYDEGYYGGNYSSGGAGVSIIEMLTPPYLYINIGLFIFGYITISLAKKYSANKYAKERLEKYNEISKEEYDKFIKDMSMDDMRKKIYDAYEQIQYAWSNFDYETIQKYTTDELYNMYKSQLESLKIKAQKNIMREIALENIKITHVETENGITKIKAYLRIKCYDYVINIKNNKVLRGKSNKKLRLEYEITLIKDINNKKTIKCPGCGAEVKLKTSKTCEYCHTFLVQNASDFVMSSKKMIHQQEL